MSAELFCMFVVQVLLCIHDLITLLSVGLRSRRVKEKHCIVETMVIATIYMSRISNGSKRSSNIVIDYMFVLVAICVFMVWDLRMQVLKSTHWIILSVIEIPLNIARNMCCMRPLVEVGLCSL